MILHIAYRHDWEAALLTGDYRANTLTSEGFIHCSTPEQVLGPANALYAGQTDLVLLVIDPPRLTADLVYEDCYEAGQAFPHIYGPLNLEAVEEVIPFAAGVSGIFTLPLELEQLIAERETRFTVIDRPRKKLPDVSEDQVLEDVTAAIEQLRAAQKKTG
ncbi:DUF952 domain-containing protein [Promineifilum sp.]|uniref:DUF952 domain-containing protein n=1 Tax=Promineifilum sp. TaxID=2664178 RepID=UPI0035B1FD56